MKRNESRRIAVGDLKAYDDRGDEEQYGECREDDDVLVTEPREGHVFLHELNETEECHDACKEEQADQDC